VERTEAALRCKAAKNVARPFESARRDNRREGFLGWSFQRPAATLRDMKAVLALVVLISFVSRADDTPGDVARLKQLDAYWGEVSRSVGTGDFAAYEATCHPEGVLVSGSKKSSSPLADALKRWKKEFDATKGGEMKASVEFKFSQRLGDATTAHETGMFLYSATGADGKETREYIHFEALLVKRDGRWKIMMEYQKSKGTRAEYEAL
jgi:ketosteroid isomerase-like protein